MEMIAHPSEAGTNSTQTNYIEPVRTLLSGNQSVVSQAPGAERVDPTLK